MFELEYKESPTTDYIFKLFDLGYSSVTLVYNTNMYNFNDFYTLTSLIGHSSSSRYFEMDIHITTDDFSNNSKKPTVIDVSFCNPDEIANLVHELKTTFELLL